MQLNNKLTVISTFCINILWKKFSFFVKIIQNLFDILLYFFLGN